MEKRATNHRNIGDKNYLAWSERGNSKVRRKAVHHANEESICKSLTKCLAAFKWKIHSVSNAILAMNSGECVDQKIPTTLHIRVSTTDTVSRINMMNFSGYKQICARKEQRQRMWMSEATQKKYIERMAEREKREATNTIIIYQIRRAIIYCIWDICHVTHCIANCDHPTTVDMKNNKNSWTKAKCNKRA